MLISTPDVAVQIFDFLDDKSLCKCREVSKYWCNFLDENKFYWRRVTKRHPGWQEFLSTIDSPTTLNLGKSFLKLLKDEHWSFSRCRPCHPIFFSIYHDDFDLFQQMIAIFPNFQDLVFEKVCCGELYPFHYAAALGRMRFVEFFFQICLQEMAVPVTEDNETPLHLAAKFGQFDAVVLLEDVMGHINGRDGDTPLHYAIQTGSLQLVQFLMDRRIEGDKNPPNDSAHTPLHYAAGHGFLEIFNLLAEQVDSPDKNIWAYYNFTPLHAAVCGGHLEIANILLDNIEWDPNPREKIGSKTPLHYAAKEGYFEVVKRIILMPSCQDPNPCDDDGTTPLCEAVERGHTEIVRFILENLSQDDLDPLYEVVLQTALENAIKGGYFEITEMLLNIMKPEDYDYRRDGNSLLHLAAKTGHLEITQLLLNRMKGDKNPKNFKGETPLDKATDPEVRSLIQSYL